MTNIQSKHEGGFFCTYAGDILLPLLQTLEHELSGVVLSEGIEPIHQSRVATRRIRAALPIFSLCFPKKKVRRWQREIKNLTSALGEARDLDVQIEFVRSYILERKSSSSNHPLFSSPAEYSPSPVSYEIHLTPHSPPDSGHLSIRRRIVQALTHLVRVNSESQSSNHILVEPAMNSQVGLECLLLRLQQRRKQIQDHVTDTADAIHESQVIHAMRDCIHTCQLQAKISPVSDLRSLAYEQAYIHIIGKIADLTWYEPYLEDSSAQSQHHQMRIAAKKLRYTLETFSGLFNDNLKKEINGIKKLQEILGDIHDCDVWIEYLPGFLEEEKSLALEYTGNLRLYDLVSPGIVMLIEDRKVTRTNLFKKLKKTWNEYQENLFFEAISSKVSLRVSQKGDLDDETSLNTDLKIACISDIHANLPALDAVIADAESRGVSVFFNAGDSIGYGNFPDETVELLRSRGISSVIGNYDLQVLDKVWKTKKVRSKKKRIIMQWTYNSLSQRNRKYLSSLPKEIRLRIHNQTVLITHGSPDSMTEYLTEHTPDCRYNEIAKAERSDIIISGHSHLFSVSEHKDTLFVNCGSVGRPDDGDPRACYALISFNPVSVLQIRVPYDINYLKTFLS
ncbi:MAG TPA: CHAD domain-containing protein [Methanospirillum sp.]|nr:CHAD domain-containing protein [Methanospirillum sp.]